MRKPLAIDLYCGLGGWAEGLLAEGYDVIGFDIERHDYGTGGYPGQLVLQDALTIRGSQFKDADVIVASPPCTEYSYMAMPWKRAKQIAAALRGQGEFPEGYKGSRTIPQLNALFDACFRIQREACEAAGRYIPMVVENVKGAQPWVGCSTWNYKSFHLWGDIPALVPWPSELKGFGGTWFGIQNNGKIHDQRIVNPARGHRLKTGDGIKHHASGAAWFDNSHARFSSNSIARKAASAQIAKIPFALASHIARVYRPSMHSFSGMSA